MAVSLDGEAAELRLEIHFDIFNSVKKLHRGDKQTHRHNSVKV